MQGLGGSWIGFIIIIDIGELSAVGQESLLEVFALVRMEEFSRVEV